MTMPIDHRTNSGTIIHSRIRPSRVVWRVRGLRGAGSGNMTGDAPSADGSRIRRNGAAVGFQAVSQATYGQNVYAGRFDFFAAPVDVGLDGVGGDLFAPFAQQIDQLVFADHAATARQEYFQQAGFAGGELYGGVVDGGHAAVQVK